ncbi:shikimate dehydrogenase family protein [Phreatobacter stygius]|uniref:Shikimate dehydrogenase n=1 Tax=Phreatobacter stygius TaxID=1940610 RepID=A0A4D7AZT3_9HYPH|nr:shikimate dehydrogenase [Phreatobacter stygius]QCI64138.1 shikimate dehydrogenase [Phreatobacter stygius]
MTVNAMTDTLNRQVLIDGATRLYAIIGDPIAQVKSPGVFNPRFAAAGLNTVKIPVHVRPERFEETVRGLMAIGNLDGMMVTVPYKARVIPLLDRVLPMAAKVGAVNAIRREPDGSWTGDMFDGRGLVRGLHERDIRLDGRRIMLIGAGGGGSAVAIAVADAGAAALTIFDVDPAKAEALAARAAKAYPACAVRAGAPAIDGHDMLINATPIGMAPGDGFPAPLDGLTADMLVVDIIMKPEVTPLLAHARSLGCVAFGGRVMLEGQAEEVARFFGIGGKP